MNGNLRLILTVAAAAIGLSACQKELEQPSGKTVHFTASEVETKTTFTEQTGNTFPVIWQQGDQVKVFLNNSADNAQTVAVIPSSDGKKAHYDVTVGIQADSYDFGFISPASAALKAEGGNYPCMVVEIPSVQTPTATSVDPAAQVLYSYVYGISPLLENMNVTMHHATAYAKINFKNLDCGKETVNSIVMTAEMNIAGQWYIFPKQNNITNKYDGHYYRPGSKTITINTHSLNDVWVALGPWDSFGGNVEFTVNTTGGKYKKTVNIPNRRLHYGDVVLMNVDMAGIEVDNGLVYRKVTDASALTPGTQVIIASDDRLHALGTTQRNTNRASASVINTGTVIFKPSKDVQILTVEKGAAAGTVAFNTGSGYLYAESAYNYLRTQDEKDGSSSWTVIISNGVTTSISTLGREIRYNEDADIFSAYTSGQIPVSIFALDPDATFKTTQRISLGFESTSMSAGLSFQLHPSYSRTPVTYKSSDESVVTVSASGHVQTVSEGMAFITATAEEDDDYYSSSATVTIKVIPEKTVSELQKNEDADVVGIVTAISTKGFILSDDTGSIFVYKMDETEGNITIGRRIGVAGTIGEYAKGLQYGQDCVLSYHYYAGIVTPSYPEPVELDEEAIAAFVSKPAATTAQYVTFAADVIDERNLIVGGGSTANVTTYYITPELKDVINANKHIIVKGYATFVQSGKCSVVVTDVQADTSIPDLPDSLNFPQSGSWAGTISFPLTVPWLQELANNGWTIKVSCDGTVFSRVTWYTSKLIYTIEDNLGSEPRTGWLKITVTKDGKSFEKTYYYSQGVLSH